MEPAIDTSKKKPPFLAAVFLCLLLGGCFASRDEIAAQQNNRCASYGFAPGSEGFANCMMQADLQQRNLAAQRSRDIINSVPDQPMRSPR